MLKSSMSDFNIILLAGFYRNNVVYVHYLSELILSELLIKKMDQPLPTSLILKMTGGG